MFKNAHVVFTFNKTFNRMRVKDTGGWWRIVIDYAAKSAKFCTGEGERGAIPTVGLDHHTFAHTALCARTFWLDLPIRRRITSK